MPTPELQREAADVIDQMNHWCACDGVPALKHMCPTCLKQIITTTLTTVRQQEREACAKVAYNYRYAEKCLDPHHDERYCQTCLLRGDGADIASEQIAAAIRARGQG